MNDTERISWPDGAWWEIRTYLSHGTARRVRETMQQGMDTENALAEVDWNKVKLHELNEVMVLSGTVAWSYGPVDSTTFHDVPEQRYQEVLQRMNVLYGGLAGPLVPSTGKNSGRLFSLLSRVAALFRRR